MSVMEKPFKVAYVVRAKHGILYRAIKERGWTINEAAEYLGISGHTMAQIINLKGKPPSWRKGFSSKEGEEKRALFHAKLSLLTGHPVEDLFPEEVYDDEVMANAKPFSFYVDRDVSTLKLGAGKTETFMIPESADNGNYDEAMSIIRKVLSPRQWQVVEMRFLKGLTLDEVSGKLKYHRERIRQIESQALKRLRKHKHILAAIRGEEDSVLNVALGSEGFDSLSQRSESAQKIV